MKTAYLLVIGIIAALLLVGCTQPPAAPPANNAPPNQSQVIASGELVTDAQADVLVTELAGFDSGLDDLNALSDVEIEAVSEADFQ
ncbi:MAG: hypothetical protein Q7R47_05460 [Candidatus Diapherotrites archaeon]|nr:hypothetical protein [Candidatus Diapherotrites archaeon]